MLLCYDVNHKREIQSRLSTGRKVCRGRTCLRGSSPVQNGHCLVWRYSSTMRCSTMIGSGAAAYQASFENQSVRQSLKI